MEQLAQERPQLDGSGRKVLMIGPGELADSAHRALEAAHAR